MHERFEEARLPLVSFGEDSAIFPVDTILLGLPMPLSY
jgi:hypothetical protein